MAPKVPPYRTNELSRAMQELVEDYELDANADGAIDEADSDALRAFAPRSGWRQEAKQALLAVATEGADRFFVPRTAADAARVTAVVQDPNVSDPLADPTRSASDIRTREIRRLLDDVSPEALRVCERELLLAALLDDHWVAPVDLWDFGLFADGEEELVARIIESTPERHMAELASRLVAGSDGGLLSLITARVNDEGFARRITEAVGEHLVAAAVELDEALAVGDVAPSSRTTGTERSRTDDATERASRYLGREHFPFGGPFQGLSYQAQSGRGDALGPVELLLHDSQGQAVPLGTINPRNFESADLMFKAIVDRFNQHYYGASGRLLVPEPWVNLAADLVPARANPSEPLGKGLVSTMPWVNLPDERGHGGTRVFELPVTSFARLLDLDEATPPRDVQRAVEARLKALGVSAPSVSPPARRDDALQLPPAQAKLLLEARAFANQPTAKLLAPNGWDFLRLVDGKARFLVPLTAATDPKNATVLRSVDITGGRPVLAVPLPATGEDARTNLVRAVNERVSRFGVGQSAAVATVDGVEVLSLAPEHARLLLKASTFAFNPHATAFDTTNLYWSTRFSDLAYLDLPEQRAAIEAELRRWGFDRVRFISKAGAEVLVASNGKMVMVACRGTQGLKDIYTDIKGATTSGPRGADADVVEPTLRQQKVGGRWVGLHSGFAGQAAEVQTEVADAIREVSGGAKLPVWFTGHSKGGAEAGILGLTLQLNGMEVAGGYGIQAARAGDEAYATLAKESGLAARWFNFQLPKDLVPHVPTTLRGYRAYGTTISPDKVSGQPNWGLTAMERFGIARGYIASGEAFQHHRLTTVLPLIERTYLDTQWTPPLDEPLVER